MWEAGEIVGDRWLLLELLGEGGLSQVWRVRHTELGRVAALKVLLLKKARLAERLVREGQIQAQLKHPHVVAVTDIVRHKGHVCLVMECVDGGTLDGLLYQRHRLPLDEALELLAPVLGAVATAHDAGVLHRDIKPSNILLARTTQGWVPKVADFGIAKVLEGVSDGAATAAGAFLGTPGYLAPEQARGVGDLDARADVFGLAAVVYETLSGTRAFLGDDLDPTHWAPPPRLDLRVEGLPEHVGLAVQRALALERADRTPDVRTFAHELLAAHRTLVPIAEGTPTPAAAALATTAPPPARASHVVPRTPSPTAAPPATPVPTVSPAGGLWVPLVVFASLALVPLVWLGLVGWPDGPDDDSVASVDPAPAEAAPEVVAVAAPPTEPSDPEATTPDAPDEAPPPEDDGAAEVVAPDVAPPTEPTPVRATPAPATPPPPEPPDEAPAAEIDDDPPDDVGTAEAPPPEVDGTPAAAAPAPEPTPTPVVVPPPDDAGGSADPPPTPLPDVEGLWRGDASGRPLRLRLTADDGEVRGDAVFVLGPVERSYAVRGTLQTDGRLDLTDGDGNLMLKGRVTDGAYAGTFQLEGARRAQPFRVDWSSR